MIPFAQFDPATLALWSTTGSLEQPEAEIAEAAMRAAAEGRDPVPLLKDIQLSDPLRSRMVWLVSSIWHEKRHFLDVCLTNYGARRFRDLFSLAINFTPLSVYAQKQSAVWFPIEVYGDSVQRKVLGIPEPPAHIVEIAQRTRKIKKLAAEVDAPLQFNGSLLEFGGEAQLEGLAQVSQLHSIESSFGLDDLVGVTEAHVHVLAELGPYRTIEAFSRVLGCAKETKLAMAVNPCLASAIFIASLCGSYFGHGSTIDPDLVSPRHRLMRLLEALGPTPGSFDMSDEEAAELVEKAATKVWGRTPFEEIAADIDGMEARVNPDQSPWLRYEHLYDAYADFLKLRRKVLAAAIKGGLASVLPRAYPKQWRDNLKPWHIVATPSGHQQQDESTVVFGCTLTIPEPYRRVYPSAVTWGRAYVADQAQNSFQPENGEAWLQMLQTHAPRARLMLNGRRQTRMLPMEFDDAVERIEEDGVNVRFHPRFASPETRSVAEQQADAIRLADFFARDRFICDVTGETIAPKDAAVLTAWEARQSALSQPLKETGISGSFMLATNWSDWIVKSSLLQEQAVP